MIDVIGKTNISVSSGTSLTCDHYTRIHTMKHKTFMIAAALATMGATQAQQPLTPEMLWQLGRVSAETLTPNGKDLIYSVTYYDLAENKAEKNLFRIPVWGGSAEQLTTAEGSENVVVVDDANEVEYVVVTRRYLSLEEIPRIEVLPSPLERHE